MIGKVQLDSFHGLGIRTGESDFFFEPGHQSSLLRSSPTSPSASSPGESFLFKDCSAIGTGRPSSIKSQTSMEQPSRSLTPQLQQPSSRYKTEMCRPFQEHGVCKYGEKCQFAHGEQELRNVNRHPKYKTDMCRTYHSVGFCPYGPRCHFIHSMEEMRSSPNTPEKKVGQAGQGGGSGAGGIKQLPMFGGGRGGGAGGGGNVADWSFNGNCINEGSSNMKSAVAQLNNFFNMSGSGGRNLLNNSTDSSRSGSFCSDSIESHSPSSSSPPPPNSDSLCTSPIDVSRSLRLPIFNRLA